MNGSINMNRKSYILLDSINNMVVIGRVEQQTVSMPKEMYDEAVKKRHLSLSKVLQRALREELDVDCISKSEYERRIRVLQKAIEERNRTIAEMEANQVLNQEITDRKA